MRNPCAMLLLLLLYIFVCPFTFAKETIWDAHADIDTPEPPPLPVFGIDFTLDGVICSASLPNGSVVGLVASRGGHWYRETMRKTLDWAEDAALRETLPDWVHDPDYPIINGDLKEVLNMTALANAVATAKHMALNVLEVDHKVKITETRPQVVISQPGFLFTDWPPSWTMDNNGHKKRIVKEPVAHWEAHSKMILQLSWAFCRAANLAHFRPHKAGGIADFDLPQYVCGSRGIPVGAPTWAVCKASGGFCETSYYSEDSYYEHVIIPPNIIYFRPNTTCARPEEVVVVADMSSEGVLIWAEGIKRCQIQDRKWSFIRSPWIDKSWSYFRHLGSDHTGWVPAVRRGIEDVVRHARHRENATANVSIITNGGFWWEQARGALRDIAEGLEMNLTMLDSTSKGVGRWERDKTFDSSMAAAAGGMMASMDPDVSDLSPLLDFVDFTGYGERGDYVRLHCREEVIAGETGPRDCDETDDGWWSGRDADVDPLPQNYRPIATEQSLSIPPSPPVFGLDFTPDGVICSVSLPDGTVTGLANERGSFAYRKTMRTLFNWAEDVALKGKFPNWMDRTDHPIPIGNLQSILDLKPLVEAVIKTKNHARERLKSQYNIAFSSNMLPDVVVSDVRFLLTDSPFPYYKGSISPLVRARFASDKEGTLFAHIFTSLQQVVRAAGLHPVAPKNGPGGDASGHQCAWNRAAARDGMCATMSLAAPGRWSRSYTECEGPEQMVLVVHMSDVGLLFWAQESRGCQVVNVYWTFHADLKVVNLDHVKELSEEWMAEVRLNIERRVERFGGDEFTPADVSVVVVSGEWTDAARKAFRDVVEGLGMNTAMLDGSEKEEEVFGVSMAAAAYGSMGLGWIDVEDLPVLSFVEEVDELIPSPHNALAVVEYSEQ